MYLLQKVEILHWDDQRGEGTAYKQKYTQSKDPWNIKDIKEY